MGVSMGLVIGMSIGNPHVKTVPTTKKVQEGYADPSKLEILLEDANADKKNEVVMKYNSIVYNLKVGSSGKLLIDEKYKKERR